MRAALAAAALAAAPATASAATWTVNITEPMRLGTVVAAASGETVFRISSATGEVAVVSGGGRRLSGGSARAAVEVSCRPGRPGDNACSTTSLRIQIGNIALAEGRALPFTAFNVTMGTAVLASGPTGASTLEFVLQPLGPDTVKTFFVGGDFPVAGNESTQPSGAGENHFFVYSLLSSGLTNAGDSDDGQVTVYRSLAVGKTADLAFGRIQIPTSGGSTVTLNPTTGARTVSGNAVAYPTPAPTAAAFSITGEGGQQVSLNVPSSLQMTGPSTLTVTLDDDAPNNPRLSGHLGQPGSHEIHVGGSFTITPATPTGTYTGTIAVTVDYN